VNRTPQARGPLFGHCECIVPLLAPFVPFDPQRDTAAALSAPNLVIRSHALGRPHATPSSDGDLAKLLEHVSGRRAKGLMVTWNPYPRLPSGALRDLLGITRALYLSPRTKLTRARSSMAKPERPQSGR